MSRNDAKRGGFVIISLLMSLLKSSRNSARVGAMCFLIAFAPSGAPSQARPTQTRSVRAVPQFPATVNVKTQILPPAKIRPRTSSTPSSTRFANGQAPQATTRSSSKIIALPVNLKLAKFEPARGVYIGAFIEKDYAFQYKTSGTKIEEFEKLTGKKHASYFTYCGYGTPFPSDWVAAVKREGGAPHIALEPNHGLAEVTDSAYLRSWARDAARTKVPIFLRWASEMNGVWMTYHGAPEVYKQKFRLVTKIMREEAPNVAMVWTPFTSPQNVIASYYPGDEAVDWVGINIYSVYVNDGDPNRPAWRKDPIDELRFIYNTYAARKPIHISEFASTLACKGTGLDTSDFAIEKMTRFYNGIRQEFPRVKSVNWFLLDTIRAGLANNNYSFLQNGRVLNAYADTIKNPYFLSAVVSQPANFAAAIKSGTTIGANGTRLREGTPSDLELLFSPSNKAPSNIAQKLTEPRLVGIRNGELKSGDLILKAQIPDGLNPVGVIWKINGRTVAISNTTPFKIALDRERFRAGSHTASVQVLDKNGSTYNSPPVDFEWK